MRGLTELERRLLGEVGTAKPDAAPDFTPAETATLDRLLLRGLIGSVPCERCDGEHAVVSAEGRRVLMLDALARHL